MTRELRVYLDPSDILGIEYECGHCHSRHSVPLANFDRVLHQCPNCKEPLASVATITGKRSDESVLTALVDALRQTQSLSCRIRLEIAEEGMHDEPGDR